MKNNITKELYGKMPDGREVYRYTLQNKNGMRMKVLDYGGIVTELWVPDRNGIFIDVVGGYDSLQFYLDADGFQGALVGRFANRIKDARFMLDGREYQLEPTSDDGHQLHGGLKGFDKYIWDVKVIDGDEPTLELHILSPDGDQNYPGAFDLTVTYKLTDKNGWNIHYVATTDKPTIANLTNHTYFNLAGYDSGSILDTELTIDADSYVPSDSELIPTGEIRRVDDTPFDFRKAKRIGKELGQNNKELFMSGVNVNGYDHCFNFTGRDTLGVVKRIEAYNDKSGIMLEVFTDRPCVQLYTGNFLCNSLYPFKNGYEQRIHSLFCLETQCMPDSINHKNFTNCVLRPGEILDTTTEYRFSLK